MGYSSIVIGPPTSSSLRASASLAETENVIEVTSESDLSVKMIKAADTDPPGCAMTGTPDPVLTVSPSRVVLVNEYMTFLPLRFSISSAK